MDDDLTRRLRALGTEPVPPSTSASHLASMAAVGAPTERRRFGRLAVGLAALTGFLVGGSGLAMAGALPAPAQDAAADVLAQVGLEAPRPASSAYGQCVSAAARAHGDDSAEVEGQEGDNSAFKAAKEACGEPGGGRGASAGKGPKEGKGPQSTPKALDDDPCTGPPPWAGRMTKAERDAAKANDPCPTRGDDGADDDGAAGAGRPEGAGGAPEGAAPHGDAGGPDGAAPEGDAPPADPGAPEGEPVEPVVPPGGGADPVVPPGDEEELDADGAADDGAPSEDA